MTLKEHWDRYTEPLESPQVYLDFAYYFTISAALERRLFFGSGPQRMYPNIYVLFVGYAGLGKGVAMRAANSILSVPPRIDPNTGMPMSRSVNNRQYTVPNFYRLADAVTFERLVEDFAATSVMKLVTKPDGKQDAYSAAYFLLEELSNLFRREKSEDVARFLLTLYDNQRFTYATKRSGESILDNTCLSLLAGTTLDFIRTAEKSGLLGEGMFSRMFLVYSEEKRHDRFDYGDLTSAQLESKQALVDHVKKLAQLYGQIIIEPSTRTFLQEWWEIESKKLSQFRNDKIGDYFSRRKLHVMKLAASLHFSRSFDMTIPLHTWEEAIALVRSLEPNIIRVAQKTGKNPGLAIQERLLYLMMKAPGMEITTEYAQQIIQKDVAFMEIPAFIDAMIKSGYITSSLSGYKLTEVGRQQLISSTDIHKV